MVTDGFWAVSAIGTGDEAETLLDAAVTLEVSDGRVSGFGGVNRYTAHLEDDVIGPIATTRMAGPPDVMAQEARYLGLLADARIGVSEEGRLQVWRGGHLLFEGEPVVRQLLDVRWELSDYDNGLGGFVSTKPGTRITAVFDESTVSGSGGCNRYRASCAVEGEILTVGQVMATRMACPDSEIGEQETRYFALLEVAARHQIADLRGRPTLEIFDGDDQCILSFVLTDTPETEENEQNV